MWRGYDALGHDTTLPGGTGVDRWPDVAGCGGL